MALRFAFALCGMRLRASGNAQLLGVCARSQKELNERVEMLLSLDMFRFWDHRELSHFMMVATNATRQRGSLLVRQVSPPVRRRNVSFCFWRCLPRIRMPRARATLGSVAAPLLWYASELAGGRVGCACGSVYSPMTVRCEAGR
jgi:hypothetical protein